MNLHNQRPMPDDGLDRILDAALTRYAAVEPRVGLEDRILANLRSEQERVPVRAGRMWIWGLVAIAAMVILVALTFTRERHARPVLVKETPSAVQVRPSDTQLEDRGASGVPKVSAIQPAHTHRARSVVATTLLPAPKLDQFPSPQPLTEEEKVLVGYIEHNPEHAALLAEARMESLRQNAEERRQIEMKDQRTTQ